jgi:hypothetical protein
MVQHDSGAHAHPAVFLVQRDHVAQMLAGVDNQRLADSLAALRGSGAARQYRHAFLAGDLDGGSDVVHAARHHHAHGHDLVDRGIRAVASTAERVEQYVCSRFPAQPTRQRAGGVVRHGFGRCYLGIRHTARYSVCDAWSRIESSIVYNSNMLSKLYRSR